MSYTGSPEYQNLIRAKRRSHVIPAVVAEHLDDASLEVITHFGLTAPQLLNEYSCAMEDIVIELMKENRDLKRRMFQMEIPPLAQPETLVDPPKKRKKR